jgi:hypothetical protein
MRDLAKEPGPAHEDKREDAPMRVRRRAGSRQGTNGQNRASEAEILIAGEGIVAMGSSMEPLSLKYMEKPKPAEAIMTAHFIFSNLS